MIQLQSDVNSPIIARIQQQYGVTVAFKQRPRAVTTTVVVRGTVTNSKPLKEATVLLMEHLTGSVGVEQYELSSLSYCNITSLPQLIQFIKMTLCISSDLSPAPVYRFYSFLKQFVFELFHLNVYDIT